jgi:hypothetical protein
MSIQYVVLCCSSGGGFPVRRLEGQTLDQTGPAIHAGEAAVTVLEVTGDMPWFKTSLLLGSQKVLVQALEWREFKVRKPLRHNDIQPSVVSKRFGDHRL